MKKKVAILVDAEWFRKMLKGAFAPRAVPSSATPVTPPATTGTPATPAVAITADLFYRNACAALDLQEEDLFRFFCYDCEPFDKQQRNPVDQSWVRFGKGNPVYEDRMKFFREIGALPYVALRRGVVKGGDGKSKSRSPANCSPLPTARSRWQPATSATVWNRRASICA